MYVVMAATSAGTYQVYGPETEEGCILYMMHKKSEVEGEFGRVFANYYMKEYDGIDNKD